MILKRIESKWLRNPHKPLFKLVYKFGKFKPYSRIMIRFLHCPPRFNINIDYALELELSK